MKQIIFDKYSGAGNDFVLIDKKKNPDLNLSAKLISELCDRRFGIGADGVLLLDQSESMDFKLDYLNSDGTGGMLCGNGARCALHYVFNNGMEDRDSVTFESAGLNYYGEKLSDDEFKFKLNSPGFLHPEFSVTVLGRELKGFYAYTGANHFVIEFATIRDAFKLNDLHFDSFNVKLFGSEIRNAKEFKPEGANINFVHLEEGKVYIRTFEKGVEDETLACGTGSTAAALFLSLKKNIKTPIELITRSKCKLKVDFKLNGGNFENIFLSGPAKKVFSGTYNY
ncbi:MAG: diaminopimelate epimerase [Ignavibacteria bacterium]|nr:MAG: diaminopimelate epimerase [Ignavibacteria bacterium]